MTENKEELVELLDKLEDMIFENFSTETFHYRQPYQIIYEDF